MSNEFTSRYEALGIPYPDPETCCKGQCEGTGVIPIFMAKNLEKKPSVCGVDETDPVLIALWEEAEVKEHAEDGWHFVKCPDCKGTGRKQ